MENKYDERHNDSTTRPIREKQHRLPQEAYKGCTTVAFAINVKERHNSVRAGLVTLWKDYPYKGSTKFKLDEWDEAM